MRLLFFLVIFFSLPAFAQDMLRSHRQNDPMAQLLDEGGKTPQTIQDYANLYYDSCAQSNEDESLEPYVKQQCACTAAKMTEFMTLDDLKTLLTTTNEGDYQQGRVFMLAYGPCLKETMGDFIFANCFYDDATRQQLRNERKVCQCYGERAGHFVQSKIQYLVPGFNRSGFNSAKSVPNPLAHILSDKFFMDMSKVEYEKCYMEEEYGWNK